jgi:hypothetical protein
LTGAGASAGGADSGADSCEGVASREGLDSDDSGLDSWLDSCAGGASWEGETSGVVLDRGASLDAFSELADPEVLLPECERVPFALAFAPRPGKALAATSEKTAVSATDPAIIQRLARPSLRSATSLAFT